jgi:hypothetical protein
VPHRLWLPDPLVSDPLPPSLATLQQRGHKNEEAQNRGVCKERVQGIGGQVRGEGERGRTLRRRRRSSCRACSC